MRQEDRPTDKRHRENLKILKAVASAHKYHIDRQKCGRGHYQYKVTNPRNGKWFKMTMASSPGCPNFLKRARRDMERKAKEIA